jgi:hypothetical protein
MQIKQRHELDRLTARLYAKLPDMVLLHGGSTKGAERIAAGTVVWPRSVIVAGISRTSRAFAILASNSAPHPMSPPQR